MSNGNRSNVNWGKVTAAREATNEHNTSPFHTACARGDLKLVRTILAEGVAVDQWASAWAPLFVRGTPLYLACNWAYRPYAPPWRFCFDRGHETAALLLAAGADPNLTLNGDNPLEAACTSYHVQLVELLLAHGATPDGYLPGPGVTSEIYAPWEDMAPSPPHQWHSPLLTACRLSGYSSRAELLVSLLLDSGADVNRRASQFETSPLYTLCIVSYQSTGNDPGFTKAAFYAQKLSIARLLLDNGADIFQPNYQGHAPIDRADGEVLALFQKHLIITIRKHVGAAPADLAPLIASFLLAPPPPPPNAWA